MEEVIKRLNKIELELASYKEFTEKVILVNTTLIQEISNNIDIKLDILCNLDNSNNANAKQQPKKSKAITQSAFFKNKLKANMNEYIDNLYTQEEIDNHYLNAEVCIKKTDLLKKNKVIDLIYNNITKNDENKKNILKEIYDEYKKNIDAVEETNE